MSVQGKKVFMISLGCSKNLVDSENMLGLLKERGFIIVSTMEKADIAIINTCGFIQAAVEESIDTIFEISALKESGKLEQVFVVGCFVQRYGYKLRRKIPEVDGWLGTGEIANIVDILESDSGQISPFYISRPTYLANHTVPRIQTTPFYSAYLKIAEGCSHGCSFCTIPSIRGPFRSREMESLILETEMMVDRGVKEINLIAQDTTMYGRDLSSGACLEDLLEKMVRIKGLNWIRILYAHPSGITDRLLDIMETESTICPYLDLPLQHINEDILSAMGRNYKPKDAFQLIDRIRSGKRRMSLRTTFMVGFSGETDDSFKELCDFIKMVEFDYLGVFIYCPEKGTRAERLEKRTEIETAKERIDLIMAFQKEISRRKNQGLVDKTVPVLIEGASSETDLLLTGRTSRMAPDVDGQVLINKGSGVVGEIHQVMIKEAYSYDLIGEIIDGDNAEGSSGKLLLK